MSTKDPDLNVRVRIAPSIAGVSQEDWDGLDHGGSPFLRHGFLRALEESGSIGGRSGWTPAYVLVEEASVLVAATAAFVKFHSYGEYIFDWAWARAAERSGMDYYPKLVVAAPMTPATGPRILLPRGASVATQEALTAAVAAGVRAVAEQATCSSIHWLFCTEREQARLTELGFAPRASLQFHWHNRGYQNFDGFLGELKSRKRKQLRKERARAQGAIDGITWHEGDAITPSLLADLDRWYRHTVDQHGGQDYLRPGFFERAAQYCADTMRVAEVKIDGKRVAGALFFETEAGLYGRYWGADGHVDLLHFETAYYAGIDRCIDKKLPLFEAGAQGEHKLLRGFEPAATYSSHWMRDERLCAGIEDFLQREAVEVAAQRRGLAAYGPYRDGDDSE